MILFKVGRCLGKKKTLNNPGFDHPYLYYMILEKEEKGKRRERTKVGKSFYIDPSNNGMRQVSLSSEADPGFPGSEVNTF